MSEHKFDEMIYAYSAGCLDKDDLLEFLDYSNSGGRLSERKLGELQNLTSLLPLILETEMPHPQVRDKFARRLFRLRDEVRVKAKANLRNSKTSAPVEVPAPDELVPEEIAKEEPKKVEIKREEFRKEEVKKEEVKKEEIKTEEIKPPIPVKKPEILNKQEILNKKVDYTNKKEPVKEPEKKTVIEDKKPQVQNKEEKKVIPEKEPVKTKEVPQEKTPAKEKYSPKPSFPFEEEEEEEKKGFPKLVIIGIAAVLVIGLIFYFMSGSSNKQQASKQTPVDSAAIKAKQEQIQKLNEQLANIQGTTTQNSTNPNSAEQKKVDDLTKELQALKEELTKINQTKAQPSQTQSAPQQQVAQQQPRNETPAVEQPREQPAQSQPVAAAARNNDNNAPAAANEVRKTEETQYVTYAEEMPNPVGGMANMLRKVNVPERAISAGVEGRVFVKAYIDESGNVVRTSVARGLGYGCDEAAEFVVRSTKFVPGKNKGKPVRVEMTIPVPFKL